MSVYLQKEQGLIWRMTHLNWGLVLLITILAGIGVACLYSAAGGSLDPWAIRHIMRFSLGLLVMMVVAMIPLHFWYKMTWPIYILGLCLLVAVEAMGHVGMGAQRWIDLGFMKLQPSELMKLAVVMAMARYFYRLDLDESKKLINLIPPVLIVFSPVGLVLLQPDLGTSLMMIMAGGSIFFMAGVPLWMFGAVIVMVSAAIPVVWQFLHDYQKQRVLTFLDPESDPLGAGYHITQSKIALGSGGIEGKGFLQGTQSHLNFLPEKQTDFIFTLWVEEWGLMGGLFLLLILLLIFGYGLFISLRSRNAYARFLALGLSVNFSLYAFINISMVMGLIPVVGAPLPLVSYGGTAMLAAMIGFGLMMSADLHKEQRLTRL